MQHKPWQFTLLASIFLMVGISLPLQFMFIYGHGLSEIHLAFQKMTNLNYLVMSLCFMNAYFTFKASRLVFITIPTVVLLVFVNNYYVALYGKDYLPGLTYIASISFLILPSILLFSRPWLVLMHPDRIWWRHEERFSVQLPIEIIQGPVNLLKTFDISASGMFLSCAQDLLKSGSMLEVKVPIGSNQCLRLQAKVVRVCPSQGSYPEGVGIEFQNTGFKEKYLLRNFLKSKSCAA